MIDTRSAPAFIAFPALHPSLAVAAVPEAVFFLDPGLAAPETPRLWRPDALPLSAEDLAGFVRDFDRLRREVKNPRDLRLLAETSGGHFFEDTTFAVREELADLQEPQRVTRRRLRAAQLTLCLDWLVEESLIDLADPGELETRFRAAMSASLGLDADADGEETAVLASTLGGGSLPNTVGLAEEFGVPWRRLLSPVWAVVPEATGLFVPDPAIAAEWLDAGLAFAPVDAAMAEGLGGAGDLLTLRETGWRLLGKTRPDPEAPWLGRPRQMIVRQA